MTFRLDAKAAFLASGGELNSQSEGLLCDEISHVFLPDASGAESHFVLQFLV
jgi:hypothetical protein